MNTNIEENTNTLEIIKTRLELMGTSQSQFAKCVSSTPTQMSLFLRGKGSLPTESLIKSLKFVGVDLSMYSKRTKLAKEVADYLLSRNISSIDEWTKDNLATFTQKDSILLFFDVQSENEYKKLIDSGIIDIESTFPYFKALVSYYLSLNKVKPTASKAKQELSKILPPQYEYAIGALSLAALIFKAFNTKIEIDENKNNQSGAIALFSKKIKKSSLLAKAMEYIKSNDLNT